MSNSEISSLSGSSASPSVDAIGAAGSGSASVTNLLKEFEQAVEALLHALESGEGNSDSSGQGGGAAAPTTAGPVAASSGAGAAAPAASGGGDGGAGAPPVQSAAGGSSHGDTAPSDTSGDAATVITNDLRSRYGLNDTQIAGVLGNLQQESGLSPDINQGGGKGGPSANTADDNGHGWGIAQWGGERKQGEIAYAQSHNLAPGSLEANVGFMNQELDGAYSKTISDLKSAGSVEQATQAWNADYEQASDPQMGNRVAYAQDFASKMA